MCRYLHGFFRRALKRQLPVLPDKDRVEGDAKLPDIRWHSHIKIGVAADGVFQTRRLSGGMHCRVPAMLLRYAGKTCLLSG